MSEGPIDFTSIALGKTSINPGKNEPAQSKKASQYIQLLYAAKCNGQWDSVPELARKVEKHAPSRKCLALASKVAARIYSNPSPSNFQAVDSELGSALIEARQDEKVNAAEVLDSTICYAALLLGSGKHEDVLAQIPVSLNQISPPSDGQGMSAWLAACVLQGTLILGLAQEALQKQTQASDTYRSILPYAANVIALPNQCFELRRWTEELLTHICLFFSHHGLAGGPQLGEAMAAFHLLSKYLDSQSWKPLRPRGVFTRSPPRTTWRAYYETLSAVIRDDLVYHPAPVHRDQNKLEHRGLLDEDDFIASRIQQRADLRRVETNYETLLLKDTQFPRANEINEEVNSWVELVMGNWEILCGPTWTNQELGSGGKTLVARNTLDILYRAATKTFHSTQILRHLFKVHVFLAEFDLAFKAFETYVEIMNKGKARAAKSGQAGITLDDDDTAIRFTSEVIEVGCRFGPESSAEKILSIGDTLSQWIKNADAVSLDGSTDSYMSQETRSLAYRAIGIGQAHFSRSTPLPTARTVYHEKAIENLGQSLKQGPENLASREAFYALSLMLAESRDVSNAIQTIKRAIQISDTTPTVFFGAAEGEEVQPHQLNSDHSTNLVRGSQKESVKQIPIWHLLVQLLCAREEFELAQKCCDSAFNEIGGLSNLLPKGQLPSKQNGAATSQNGNGPVNIDTLTNLEKQSILELKMTHLSLVEINEGADAAVNGANELLGLFSNLVGPIDSLPSRKKGAEFSLIPPKSSSGTVRSVFGRPKSMRRTILVDNYSSLVPSKTASALTSRPTTSATVRPAMQGTSIAGNTASPANETEQNEKNGLNTLQKKSSSVNRPETAETSSTSKDVNEKRLLDSMTTSGRTSHRVSFQQDTRGDSETEPVSSPRPFGNISTNMDPEKKPAPPGQVAQPPEQDTRLPVPHPKDSASSLPPMFIELQDKRQKTSLLIKIWLFAARLYLNLALPTDARGAVQEARKLVSNLETELSQEKASVSHFQERSWGGGRSLEELWADIYTEEGKILRSQSLPHDALLCFEKALSHHTDHLEATIGVSDILLDIYSQTIPLEKNDVSRDLLALALGSEPSSKTSQVNGDHPSRQREDPSQELDSDSSELSRLASRDRAYGLLSSITKLGIGWDSPEAWFTLSRAYEMSGQIDKAKEALWWTVRLEDTKPLRHWRNVNLGGYTL